MKHHTKNKEVGLKLRQKRKGSQFCSGLLVVLHSLCFPQPFFGRRWGGAGATFDTLGGGWLPLKMDCIGVKTTYGVGSGLGGVRYQKGMPNVKHRRLRVTMTGVVMIPDGGDKKGIC